MLLSKKNRIKVTDFEIKDRRNKIYTQPAKN